MSIKFKHDSAVGEILFTFWQSLDKNRGVRAELRRCKTIADVIMTPSYQRLCARLRPVMKHEYNFEENIAAVIGLLSHLKTNSQGRTLPQQMAESTGNNPLVSELRFRRLLQRDREDLYGALIRILRMLKGEANLYSLSESVFYWGDNVKKQWSFAYFPLVPEKKSA